MASYGDSTLSFGSATCPVPTGSTGDILLAWTYDCTGAPAGFTQRATVNYDGTVVRLWTKTRTSSEGSNYAFTPSVNIFPCVIVVNVPSGVEAPTTAAPTTGTSSTATGPNITAPSAGGLLCFIPFNVSDVLFNSTPSGMTERENAGDPTDFLELWTQEIGGGASGQRSVTLSGSGNWVVSAAIIENANVTGPGTPTLSPLDGATNVSPTANLVLTFGENVQADTGDIRIVETGVGTVETIDITDTGKVNFSGGVVTINPATTLTRGTGYHVEIDNGAIISAVDSEAWPGIADATTWNFTIRRLVQYENSGAVATGTTSVAPAYPSGIQAGDLLLIIVGQKPSSANGGTATTPTSPDWTRGPENTGATDGNTGGYNTTLAADTGNTNIYSFYIEATGSESGTRSITLGTSNTAWAQMHRFSKESGTWDVAGAVGKDTSAGNVSITFGSNPGVAADDHVIVGFCIPTDVTTPSQFSSHALSQSGVTFGTVNEISEPDSGTGNDIGGVMVEAAVTAGTGSAAPQWTATAGGTTTNVRGPALFVRVRAASGSQEVEATPGAAAFTGVNATPAAGAVEAQTAPAEASFSALDATGQQSVSASPAEATWSGVDAAPLAGGVEVATSPADSAWSAVDAGPAVAIDTAPASGAFSALDATATASASAATTPADAAWAAVDAAPAVAATTSPAEAAWSAVDATVEGDAEVATSVAEAAWSAVDATTAVSVSATQATLASSGVDATPEPGAVELATTPASAAWSALDAAIDAAGEVSTQPGEASWTGVDAAPEAGAVAVAASPGEFTGTALDATAAPGEAAMAASPAEATWSALDATVEAAGANQERDASPAEAAWSGVDATPQAGSVEAAATVGAAALSALDAGTAAAQSTAPATAAWSALDATAAPGAVTAAAEPAEATWSALPASTGTAIEVEALAAELASSGVDAGTDVAVATVPYTLTLAALDATVEVGAAAVAATVGEAIWSAVDATSVLNIFVASPPERTAKVARENRTLRIATEDRSAVVPAEIRRARPTR